MPKPNLLTRDLYRSIKGMNRETMEKTINNIYDMGAKDALENAVIDLDVEKIRTEIGAISGIGEKRLEQIMEIIQRNIKEADEKGEASEVKQ
ncbi:MAG: hypothetical protein IK093_20500 [Ruminiclostridium sp.]|nr:hypothetical protein [Ruminiclostridium sp.]